MELAISRRRFGVRRWPGLLLALCALFLFGVSSAQGLSEEARTILRQGQQKAAQAMVTYPDHFPDQPLWDEAIALGERARRLAPERLEPYRFLGQVYSVTGWYSRAWDAWQSYRRLGGEMDAQARTQLLAAATWLGFNSYSNGDYRRALTYLEEAHRLNPQDRLTLSRITESYLALGEPEEARPFAERLAAQDDSSDSLLARVEAYLEYGVEAVDAVRQGESLYSEGRTEDALRWFTRATEMNPNYATAFERAGQVALELGLPGEAAGFFQTLVELEPGNDEAQAALTLARNRAEYGEEAYAAYSLGMAAYERGDPEQAEQLLLEALAQNPDIADAHAVLGRILFSRGEFEPALERFRQAAQLAPDVASYRFYISAAEEQIRELEEARALAEERERAQAEERARAAEAARVLEQAQRQAEEEARAEAAARAQAAEEAAAQRAAEEAAAQRATQAAAAQETAQAAAQEEAAQEPVEPPATQDAVAEEAAAEREQAQLAGTERAGPEQAAAEQTTTELPAAEQATTEEPVTQQPTTEEPTTEATATDQGGAAQAAGAQAAQLPQTSAAEVAGAAVPATSSSVLVIANESITHVSAEEGGSGAFSFLPGESLERNLASPVDFTSGTLFQRLEVLSKPSDVPVHYQLCLVPNDSISVQPACTSSNLLVFEEEGVFEAQQPVSSLSGFQGIDWGNGLESVILVIKDPSGVPVDNRYLLGNGNQEPPDPELYYPMEVRFTAVVVPDGMPFPGWPQ